MKPEPLTKEKTDETEILKRYKYLTSLRRQVDFLDGFNHAMVLTKSAVEWLLKEIDNTKFATSKHLQDAIREDVKKLVKKAFSGVVE